jgi:hypothetical protein
MASLIDRANGRHQEIWVQDGCLVEYLQAHDPAVLAVDPNQATCAGQLLPAGATSRDPVATITGSPANCCNGASACSWV